MSQPASTDAETPTTPDLVAADAVAVIRDLHVGFTRGGRQIEAVRGVSLDIAAGEILGLVGESGSGKSVLSLALLGLLPEASRPRTSGEVSVSGTDMLTSSTDTRRQVRKLHMGAVFQDPMTSLNPTMRIGRQVAEAAGSGQEALRLLRAVGIPEAERRMSSFPHELSGGLRQRVMIAMAVAGDPALLVADEPTTALDVTVQAQVLNLLRGLRDEVGCSVLLITHDLGVAAQVADRVAVMYAGRLAEVGPTATILARAVPPVHRRPDQVAPLADHRPFAAGARARRRCPRPVEPAARMCLRTKVSAGHGRVCDDRAGTPAGRRTGRAAARGRRQQLRHALAGLSRPVDEVLHLAVAPEPERPMLTLVTAAAATTENDEWAAHIGDVDKTFRVKAGRGRKVKLSALRRISLDIGEGESVAIVGESGSGKSTLLRVLAGLETHEAGDVAIAAGGRPQMVFQDAGASLTPWLTVGDLLDERLRTEGIPRPSAGCACSRRSTRSGCPRRWRARAPASCPAASASGSPWPAQPSYHQGFCSATSRPAPSTCPWQPPCSPDPAVASRARHGGRLRHP